VLNITKKPILIQYESMSCGVSNVEARMPFLLFVMTYEKIQLPEIVIFWCPRLLNEYS
jgi:hypothetical protein